MSEPGESTTDTQTSSDNDWHYAVFVYLIAYNLGTIVLEFDEPTSIGLGFGGITTAGLAWAAGKTGWPRSSGLVVLLLPILMAAVVIATPLND
ncbi:MAG: hypothetical protein ACRDO7_13620 [Nocardioidaceae bacterium]